MSDRTRIKAPLGVDEAAFFLAALDLEPVGVAMLSIPDLVYEYVNPAFQAFAPGKRMVGERNIDVFPEMQYLAERVLPMLEQTGAPWRGENIPFQISRSPGGPLETVYGTVQVARLVVGGVVRLLVTSTENTESVLLRQELDRSRERLLLIVEAISQGFVAVDHDGRVTYLNHTAAELAAVDPREAMGRDVSDVLPVACAGAEGACTKAIRDHAESRFEVAAAPGGGAFEVHVFPTSEGAVIVLADVSERKAVDAEREQALARERRMRETSDRLNEIQRVVTSTLEFEEILRRVTSAAAELTRSDAAGVGLYEGDRYVNHALAGIPSQLTSVPVAFTETDALGIVRRTGEIIVVDDVRGDERFEQSLVGRFGVRSLILAPFTEKGRVIGCLGLYRRHVSPFTAEEVDTTRKIAAITGLATGNARLYDEQQYALTLAEALDDINHAIHSSLDYDEIMQRALDEATRALGASAGTVFLGVTPTASEARYVSGLPKLVIGRRFEADQFPFAGPMAETKDPLPIGPEQMGSLMNRTIGRMFGIRSMLAIPLVSRGELVGGIGLIYRSARTFSAEDVGFARRFGASVSLALDNAELYRRQERVADTLQEALLTLPKHIKGIEVSHVYHSATEAAKVGGDFYDVFELEHHTVGLTVGDISGKGLDAAVLTSLVKNAVRTQATETGNTPADALRVASEVLLRGSGLEIFATVFFGLLDLDTGRLLYCNGGHTTPLVIGTDGSVARLPSNSPLVGAVPGVEFRDDVAVLIRDATLLLYTDGVIEARRGAELYGEERLVELAARLGRGSPSRIVGDVIDDVVAFAGGELSDDVAILAVRRA